MCGNWHFRLGGGDFFQVGLENSLYKKSEYKSLAKQMIPIAVSTISHFRSPTLTICGSLYLYLYFPWYILPPTYKYIFFVGG